MQGDVPPVPVSEEDEFLSMLKQQANILHQLQQQRGLAPVSARSQQLPHPALNLPAGTDHACTGVANGVEGTRSALQKQSISLRHCPA